MYGEEDYEPGDECDRANCDFCHQPIDTEQSQYFQSYQGHDLIIHSSCLPQVLEKDSQMQANERAAMHSYFAEQSAALEQMEQEQARRYNSLSARINRGWHTVRYLIKVRYRPEGFSDLEFLAHCLLKQHLDHYQVPLWLAPTRLTRLQRKMMINEADWAAEGGLKKAELSKMSDQDLAVAYLGALRDYCVSQGLT